MTITAVELFHGVVLTRLVRGNKPIAFKMFAFNADKSSSAYIVNDKAAVYIKHSKTPRLRQRKGYNCAWSFTFSPEHLGEIRGLGREVPVHTAFVCADRKYGRPCQYICFLTPGELSLCVDLNADTQQNLIIANLPRGKLRVWGSKKPANAPLLISKNALERWSVPGN